MAQLVAMWRLGHVFSVMVSLAASAKIGRTSAVKPYLTLPLSAMCDTFDVSVMEDEKRAKYMQMQMQMWRLMVQ